VWLPAFLGACALVVGAGWLLVACLGAYALVVGWWLVASWGVVTYMPWSLCLGGWCGAW